MINLEQALRYEKLGMSVIPINPKGKNPMGRWKKKQTVRATEDEIREYWKNSPDANVGIVTGEISGIDVIDFDGSGARAMLEEKLGEKLLESIRSSTGGGGEHLFLKHNKNARTRAKIISDGNGNSVDVRADGGIIVLPPSIHPNGNPYEWIEEPTDDLSNLAEWTPELIKLLGESSMRYEGTSEGQRNDTLTRAVGSWIHDGRSFDIVLEKARELNRLNTPPLPDSEVMRTVRSIFKTDQRKKKGRPPSRTNLLIKLAIEKYDLFHDEEGDVYATKGANTFRIASVEFTRAISSDFYHEFGKGVSNQDIRDANLTIAAKAVNEGPQRRVFIRVAVVDRTIYIDLANEERELIRVNSNGWDIIQFPEGVVHFLRPKGMIGMPHPIRGGTIEDLCPFVNLENPDDLPLIKAFMVNMFNPWGPYPGLELNGPQGAAKTSLMRLIKRLTDPSTVEVRSLPKTLQDLAIAAANQRLLVFDNVSRLSEEMSNALCRLATGGGFATRSLYTDREETLFYDKRPFIMNGISASAIREDLADRMIRINLKDINEKKRRPERELWKEFERLAPGILGSILDAVACALRRYHRVELPMIPRMADFAVWVTAAEPAIGLEDYTILHEYSRNRKEIWSQAIDSNLALRAIRAFIIRNKKWQGTMTELLNKITLTVGQDASESKYWPKIPKRLSEMLDLGKVALRCEGIKFRRKKINGIRVIEIRWLGDEEVTQG